MPTFEILIVAATFLGPIVAVQVQKYLERQREERQRRLQVFKQLMATRGARLSPEHVQALNMIDLEFPVERFRQVADAWHSYRDHLSPTKPSENETQATLWNDTSDRLFGDLLAAMGNALGYSFDRVMIAKGSYYPTAHGNIENDLNAIRKSMRALLSGETTIKMDVVSFPDMEDSESQKQILEGVNKLLLEEKK